MIRRIYTRRAVIRAISRAVDAALEGQRAAFAEEMAAAIETLLPADCAHDGHRPLCARCSARTTVRKAAALVREMGGVR
jgi:hypothetical protein